VSSEELQRSVVSRLRNDSGVVGVVGQRTYDLPPITPTFPYITLGPDTTVPQRAECYEGDDVLLQIDAWSRTPGFQEVKRIAKTIRDALRDPDILDLEGYRLIDLFCEESRVVRDPDGLTSHAILTFRALTEPET